MNQADLGQFTHVPSAGTLTGLSAMLWMEELGFAPYGLLSSRKLASACSCNDI